MKKYATIKDIAKALNISVATVSRALADRWDVNPSTKKLVKEEAERQNYKPNPIATRLQNKRTKTIGVVVPEFKSSFFPNIILGIQNILDEAGFQLLIAQSNESMANEEKILKLFEGNMVEGILVSINQEQDNINLYNKIINSGIPIVFFNRVSATTLASKVVIDNYKMAFFATEHLIYNKFEKIIHFAGPASLKITQERKKGFEDAMKKHHRVLTSNSIIDTGIMSEQGHSAMKKLIEESNIPDAIFCFNDPVAFGALKALKESNITCPDTVALVGFSETEMAQLVEPPLTSVEQPTFKMGETAANILLEQIELTNEQQNINFETTSLTAHLHVRKSSINKKI